MTGGRVLSFDEARRNKAKLPQARWANVADAFSGDVFPALQPSFRIRPDETVFTIGSCFARNIEQHLADVGCRVPMLELHLPADEWNGGANGAMNKFHPPAFRQCLEWTAGVRDRGGQVSWEDCEGLAFDFGDGRFFDMDMAPTPPVSRERFIERRQHIYEVFSAAFSADCLMITPGLIEAWRDRTTGRYIHEPPTQKAMVARRDRWEFEILSYDQCLTDLLAAIDVVRARNPGVRILITTSPVPMSTTFSGQDIRVANAYSKSVLRAVCGAASFERHGVDYFPSYESATLTPPDRVWEPDRIHVAGGFVGKIVTHMLDHYLEGGDAAARGLQAARTLLFERRYDEAEAAARTALSLRPETVEAGAVRAEALIGLRRCAEAETQLRGWIGRHPERADLRVALARAIVRGDKSRSDEAIAEIEAATALPSMSLAEFRSVEELVRRRASPEAAERLARVAIERFPLHVEAYRPLANLLIDQGRTVEAIQALRRAAGLRRASAALRLRLADLLVGDGQAEEAQAVVRAVLKLEPANAVAKALLARIEGGRASA
ncbi:MAG TPA: GSCFA domain-containing protein [Caulobacteraceae bacterium]